MKAYILLLVLPSFYGYTPNYQGCDNSVANALPYCDLSLSMEARLNDLMGRLNVTEKIQLLHGWSKYSTCACDTKPIERVGLPGYTWLIETNTGVSTACLGPDKCATTFIGPEGLGAAFNRTLWYAKGDVISTELRAFSNAHWHRGGGTPYKVGFDGFGPNLNIVRDPRFGRNSELPGEDPMLTGTYGAQYVKGIQQTKDGYMKMLAFVKHYDAYSVETNRMHSNANISQFDFWDTYLRQYAIVFLEGRASGAMCSYAAENGIPSCANGWLLNTVIRQKWNSPDAFIMTDCGALRNMQDGPPLHASGVDVSAWALNNGTDVNAGDNTWRDYLYKAYQAGLVSEQNITQAAARGLRWQFRAGRFDPPAKVPWTTIGTDQINSTAHQQVRYESALQGMVLLRNDNNLLPLKKGTKIAVVGPQGVAQEGLLSDYYGDWVCYAKNQTNQDKYFGCIPKISDEISRANTGGTTTAAQGVTVKGSSTTGIAAALKLCEEADVVVLALGIDRSVEHEGIDRKSTTLPGLQEPFAMQVIATGKPIVLILTNGGILSVDNLKKSNISAIVEAFNPAFGASAIADTLFGNQNRWGRLPVTIYPADYINQVELTNFDMSKPPGRTYRYYTGTPLWPFGFGMTYSTMDNVCDMEQRSPPTITITCKVSIGNDIGGDEVLMVYHSVSDAIKKNCNHPVPIKELIAFERVTVSGGHTESVQFNLSTKDLSLVTKDGGDKLYDGDHYLTVWNGNSFTRKFTYTVRD